MEAVTRWVLVALAAVNVGLTVWHWRILRRARAYQADTRRLHDEAEGVVGDMQHAPSHVAIPLGGTNGTRPAVEHKDGPEP